MDPRPLALLVLPSPLVLAFWWLIIAGGPAAAPPPGLAGDLAAYLVWGVILNFGPLAGVGAVACGRVLLDRGWRAAWYAVPGVAVGTAASAVTGWCFVFVAGPVC